MGSGIEFWIAGPATENALSLNIGSCPLYCETAAVRRMYSTMNCQCQYFADVKISKPDIAVRNRNYHTATGNHMPYEITQCYLPPGRGDFPAFTPAKAGTRFSDRGGMQGWVDLGCTGVMYRRQRWFWAMYISIALPGTWCSGQLAASAVLAVRIRWMNNEH